MGYYSRAQGEITFSPELPRYACRGIEEIVKFINPGNYEIYLDPEWSTISAAEDEFKAYDTQENLTELVNAILKVNPDTIFDGYLEIQGEGDGIGDIDLCRLRVKKGKVVEVRPELIWPED